jgi:hypothetical protein
VPFRTLPFGVLKNLIEEQILVTVQLFALLSELCSSRSHSVRGMSFRKPSLVKDYLRIGIIVKYEKCVFRVHKSAATVAYFSVQTYFFKHNMNK